MGIGRSIEGRASTPRTDACSPTERWISDPAPYRPVHRVKKPAARPSDWHGVFEVFTGEEVRKGA